MLPRRLLQPAGLPADTCGMTCTSAWTHFFFSIFPSPRNYRHVQTSPNYGNHLALLVMSECSNNVSDMHATCARWHLFVGRAAFPSDIHVLLWSFSIDSLWVISKLMTCERRSEGRTFGTRRPDWQDERRWVVHKASLGGWGGGAEAERSDQQSAEMSTLKTTIAQFASMIIF